MARGLRQGFCARALALVLAAGGAHAAAAPPAGESTLEFGRFGAVQVYRPAATPTQLVLFISGDGGWNSGVVDMARHLVERGALVAGIDVNHWGKNLRDGSEGCIFTAGDLEQLAHEVESRYRFPRYVNPLLVGYSSGATLAYTSLVQSPRGTFKGALSLGFCPDLPWQKPMCRGDGAGLAADAARPRGYLFRPAPNLRDPWIALHGAQDQVCDISATRDFVGKIPGARLVELPKVGHGYGVERNYLEQFFAAYDALTRPPQSPPQAAPAARQPGADISGLPLVEVPPTAQPRGEFAIMLSGDGGWSGLDRELGDVLAGAGIAVVGWDSLRYFWTGRTPDGAAADLDRIIRHYLAAWGKTRVVLIGYSLGGDTLPFLVSRLPTTTRAQVVLTTLIAPGTHAWFEFHVTDWMHDPAEGLPLAPELKRLEGSNLLCIYAAEEPDSACATLRGAGFRSARMPGGHHFEGDYAGLARQVLQSLPAAPARQRQSSGSPLNPVKRVAGSGSLRKVQP